jgi:hypothetical protein
LSISYDDLLPEIDVIPIPVKEDVSGNLNIGFLVRMEVYHTGF